MAGTVNGTPGVIQGIPQYVLSQGPAAIQKYAQEHHIKIPIGNLASYQPPQGAGDKLKVSA